ncbi:MAG: hypothetical protein WD398_05585 [Cyclobacteriaceae bacterium]
MNINSLGNTFQDLDLSTTLIAIFLLVIGWFLKFYFDKYFLLKPKLYLTMNGPMYGQKFINYEEGHELTWRYECVLKNNSNFDGFNIKITEQNPAIKQEGIISNKDEIKKAFRSNNHLSSKGSMEFEIKKTISINADVLIKSKIVDGVKEVYPGSKLHNPKEELKPAILDDFSLIIKYENEKGKSLYTKYRKKNGFESNTFYLFKYPFLV